jgi:hypothetical protein
MPPDGAPHLTPMLPGNGVWSSVTSDGQPSCIGVLLSGRSGIVAKPRLR